MNHMPEINAGFPAGWVTAQPKRVFPVDISRAPDEGVLMLLLEDGTNLALAWWNGGRRFARIAFGDDPDVTELPPLEEVYDGTDAPPEIADTWRIVMVVFGEALGDQRHPR